MAVSFPNYLANIPLFKIPFFYSISQALIDCKSIWKINSLKCLTGQA